MNTIDSKKRAKILKIIMLIKSENISGNLENLGTIVCGWKSPLPPVTTTINEYTTGMNITLYAFPIQFIMYYTYS